MIDEINMSEKLKIFLERKLIESKGKIKKLKRKRNIYKTIMIVAAVSSIGISAVTASISITIMPPIAITILSVGSAALTGISAKFNFENKTIKITREIERLDKIQSKLDYVVSCNGDLTKQEYNEILKEFNF